MTMLVKSMTQRTFRLIAAVPRPLYEEEIRWVRGQMLQMDKALSGYVLGKPSEPSG